MTNLAHSEFRFEDLTLKIHPNVYTPRDDSVLLAMLVKRFAKGRFLDLGCGSGLQGLVALRRPDVSEVVFADRNQYALENVKVNVNELALPMKPVHFLETDLFSSLEGQMFDTICFNPPYLPTNHDEIVDGPIGHAWDGGADGRKFTDPFLKQFSTHLSKTGVLLMTDSSLAKYEKTLSMLRSQGFHPRIHARERFFFEELVAIKAERRK
ncbi:methyltransferase [Candidatus Micrarchaeota archaeon]|nr:methyltransferase [Candidatus Micrarchaeota archaeon]